MVFAYFVGANCINFILQVYVRLQKLMLSMSHPAALATIDKLGANFDSPVLQWKENLVERTRQLVCTGKL